MSTKTTIPTIAGETRIHSLPGRPPFMLIREIAEIVGIRRKSLEWAFNKHKEALPAGSFIVLKDAEFREKWTSGVSTSQGRRTDLQQVGITEQGAIILLGLMTGAAAKAGLISLTQAIFAERTAREEALRSALIKDEAKFIGRSTIKATIKLGALEGWSFARLAEEVSCSVPVLAGHVQAMRLRGYIAQDALLPPIYVLRDVARRKAIKAGHLMVHEADARQLLLGLEG